MNKKSMFNAMLNKVDGRWCDLPYRPCNVGIDGM